MLRTNQWEVGGVFTIDYKSRTPIYRQIIDNVEKMAGKGILPPDSQLPSVRALAVELSINPNTIAKAYTELESLGIIYSLPGRGSFVTADIDKLREQGKTKISSQLKDIAEDAVSLQMAGSDFINLCDKAWQDAAKGGAINHD